MYFCFLLSIYKSYIYILKHSYPKVQKKYIKEFEDLYPNYTEKDVCVVVEDNNSSLLCKRKRNATIIEFNPVPQDVQNNSLSNRRHRSYINNYTNNNNNINSNNNNTDINDITNINNYTIDHEQLRVERREERDLRLEEKLAIVHRSKLDEYQNAHRI